MKFQNPQVADALSLNSEDNSNQATSVQRRSHPGKKTKSISKSPSPALKSKLEQKKEELLQEKKSQDLQSSIT
jgi:hypothetical protein